MDIDKEAPALEPGAFSLRLRSPAVVGFVGGNRIYFVVN
jgi:hypothetical protein